MKKFAVIIWYMVQTACLQSYNTSEPNDDTTSIDNTRNDLVDTLKKISDITYTIAIEDSLQKTLPPATSKIINTGNVTPDQLIGFAQTLIGIPYVYGSSNPKVGFDCSGFITYVFNHFNIQVARSSVDFTDVGKLVPVTDAKKGDIILFTGTNPSERVVGHMGLVVSNENSLLKFIHSTSGKQMSVTITELNDYYKNRFVSVRRIFAQNDR